MNFYHCILPPRITINRGVYPLAAGMFFLLLLAGCRQQDGHMLTIEGKFAHAAGKQVMLAELPFSRPERLVLDSATLDSTGKFTLEAVQTQEGIYQVFIKDGPGLLLINDATKITLNADADDPGAYTVAGSPASQSLKRLYTQFTSLYAAQYQASKTADSAMKTRQASDSLRMATQETAAQRRQRLEEFLTSWMEQEKNATANWYALGLASRVLTPEAWAAQLDKARDRFPQHAGITLMKVSQESAAGAERQGKEWLNKTLPDITLPDTSGTAVSLSSFRGKWVLLDFWASWCAPCREENPNLLEAWRQMRMRNFTIVGISLDKAREPWLQAIAADTLTWNHLSDLKFWESRAVSAYRVEALPFNMLLDPSGVVKAINLRDTMLLPTLRRMVR